MMHYERASVSGALDGRGEGKGNAHRLPVCRRSLPSLNAPRSTRRAITVRSLHGATSRVSRVTGGRPCLGAHAHSPRERVTKRKVAIAPAYERTWRRVIVLGRGEDDDKVCDGRVE